MLWQDGKNRCVWANPKNPLYIKYHDEEWGRAVHDDHTLFQMLILEGFQAGLTWECILNKREDFVKAFAGFDVKKVAKFDAKKEEELRQNQGIVRNKLKIHGAVVNAQLFLEIQKEFGSFDKYLWQWSDNKTVYERGLATSPLSDVISKDLKKRGMKFVGSTIIYAYLQGVGIINSHSEDCFLYAKK